MSAGAESTSRRTRSVTVQRALRDIAGEVRIDPYTLHLYSSDASMYAIEPVAVALPRSREDVSAITAVAAEMEVPVIARGAGTSLAGQTVGHGIVVDLSRHMHEILDVDAGARTARVQPGVVQDQLNRAAAPHGLMFGADTSTSNRATIGGMIGNNSSGTHSVVYGTTADHIRAVDVVLSDATQACFAPEDRIGRERRSEAQTLEGRIFRHLPTIAESHQAAVLRDFPKLWRQSGGYRLDRLVNDAPSIDLARFLTGTEGTLAIVTEAQVSLVPRPKAQAIGVGHFASTLEAVAATVDALSLQAAAVELMDSTILELSRSKHEFAELSRMLEGSPAALVFVTFFGEDERDAASQVERLAGMWRRHGHGYHTLRAVSATDRAAVLKVRKSSLGLLMAASRGTRRPLAFVEDTAVEPDRLVDYVARLQSILQRHGLVAGFYGHCSVGCLHIRPFVDLTDPSDVSRMRSVAEEVLALVIEFGGVNSSEHGDGLARSQFNEQFFGRELYEAMRQVKHLFDPHGLLNPGKIVDAPSMTENLRDPAIRRAEPLRTYLKFSEPGGMLGAADRCMNIGACRKTDAGTMCPSYVATREEEHATRGRANALVKALSDPVPLQALADERLHEILDLCLGCKACKAECPLSVDMASMKSEFLAHYHDAHGVPMRARLFGRIWAVNRLGAALAPVSNWAASRPAGRRLLRHALGIAVERPLPRFERHTLMSWFASRSDRGISQAASRDVVFLADSFTSFTERVVPQTAIELLERAGYRVVLESGGCCGRSSLSKGLVTQARRMAQSTVDRLVGHAERGVPIVGCEPSCLLTLKDEYLDLLPDDPRAALVASHVTSVAELLLAALREGAFHIPEGSDFDGRTIVLHPHCHEKAVTGVRATTELLRAIPGARLVELDVGCCGMAGSFGFEAEHYNLSVEIARGRLLSGLQEQRPGAWIAATGISCRQQIRHVTQRGAHHPLELVHAAVTRAPCGSAT